MLKKISLFFPKSLRTQIVTVSLWQKGCDYLGCDYYELACIFYTRESEQKRYLTSLLI